MIALCFCVFIILVGVGLFGPKQSLAPGQTLFPTPTTYPLPTTSTNANNAPIPIASDTGKKMVEKVINRKVLQGSDATLRKKLADFALNQPGEIIYTSSLFDVTYIKAFDLFQVEILNQDINSVKQKAVAWFIDYGFSQDGVCNLPIMFILGENAADSLRGTTNGFDLLPPGC